MMKSNKYSVLCMSLLTGEGYIKSFDTFEEVMKYIGVFCLCTYEIILGGNDERK